MTTLTILGSIVTILLLPLIVSATRHRSLATLALRNISRRRGEAALVVAGSLLGTAIITSALVVGDVVEASFTDVARTQLGPVDVVLTPTDGGGLDGIVAAVGDAEIAGIDGLLATTVGTGTLQASEHQAVAPRITVAELDLAAARAFGGDPAITGVAETGQLGRGEIVVNEPAADRLAVDVGDTVRLHAHGDELDLVVAEVAAEVGLAGANDAIVAPGTLPRPAGATSPAGATPPREQLLVSLDGGVLDTRELSDAVVAQLRTAVGGLPGVEVTAPKAVLVDDAERDGAGFTELFSIIGTFSVLAGVLLLVNLFVMLAEERKTELGMLRALGFTRRRLVRAFAIEGAVYALVAAAMGAVVGVGIGWIVAVVAGDVLGFADQTAGFPLVVDPGTLALGASIGATISLVTIWVTSLRIARLHVIRAIRDLPDPPVRRARTRTLVLAAGGVVAGLLLTGAGILDELGTPLLLGVPVAAFAASPLLRRVLPARAAGLLVAVTVLMWALASPVLFPVAMDVDGDPALFVLKGVVLTAGAVSLATGLDRVWMVAIDAVGRGGRGLAPRLGLVYPLARRFRTSMLLSMFSLVIFTVTILATVAATFDGNAEVTSGEVAAGYDLLVEMDPANPVPRDLLEERDDVSSVAELVRGVGEFTADHLDGPRSWAITGFGTDLLAHGSPSLADRDATYGSDAATFRAVVADPSLAIVPEGFLDGVGGGILRVGDTFAVIDRSSGMPRELTVVGLGDMDWVGGGALVSHRLTTELFGTTTAPNRAYVEVADGTDPTVVATSIDLTYLAHGADAETFVAVVTEAMRQQTGLLAMLQGFLGLGLLVGTAGLGVVMVRAVRERRQEIGILRAMGLRTGLVRAALLSEAGLIAVQGTVIGAVLGLLTARQLLLTMGDQLSFVVPWVGLLVIVTVPLVAALGATAWPASRAAAIRPAVAIRTAT